MKDATIYNTKGEEAGKYKLPEDVFGAPWNADLVHQVVQALQTSVRKTIAHVKDRGDVRGGGKKPWQQKGTGRARHGSTRSPLWVGGGVTHGPTNEKNFARKINQKMKAKALYTLLSRKLKHGEVIFLDSMSLSAPKAKEAKGIISSIGKIEAFKKLAGKKSNALLVAMDKKDALVEKGFRNFGNVQIDEARNLNPVALATYKYVMFVNPAKSVGAISGKIESGKLNSAKLNK
ncbi:MAG: 50S ribosomal protein L4 [Patescibacteria group bacterium]